MEPIADGTTLSGYEIRRRLHGSFIVPDHIERIGIKAFAYRNYLEEVAFPKGLQEIGEKAFYMCSRLHTAIIPYGVEVIGKRAFKGCRSLQRIKLPKSLKYIGDEAFAECDNLIEVTMDAELARINNGLFKDCHHLLPFDLPVSVKEIGAYAFYGCREWYTEVLPPNLQQIGAFAFAYSGMDYKERLMIPDSVRSIGKYAFTSVARLRLPRSLSVVERCIDGEPSGNVTIEIPEGLNINLHRLRIYQTHPEMHLLPEIPEYYVNRLRQRIVSEGIIPFLLTAIKAAKDGGGTDIRFDTRNDLYVNILIYSVVRFLIEDFLYMLHRMIAELSNPDEVLINQHVHERFEELAKELRDRSYYKMHEYRNYC